MAQFPVSSILPLKAKLAAAGPLGKPSIEVMFAAFSFNPPEGEGSEPLEFNTSLRADFIDLPTTKLPLLEKQTFEFPVNPEDGYIDASIYFANAHNPVDVSRLAFGNLSDGKLRLTMVTKWIMTHESTGFDDFDLTFSMPLS